MVTGMRDKKEKVVLTPMCGSQKLEEISRLQKFPKEQDVLTLHQAPSPGFQCKKEKAS